MKRFVVALVVFSMILLMVPTTFATTESNGFMLAANTPYEWTAEYTGTATLYGEPIVNIMINNGDLGMGYSPSFEVTAGTTYTIQHFGDGFAWITWEIEVSDGNEPGGNEPGADLSGAIPSGSALALGDNNVALSYATVPFTAPSWTYTAAESGNLTVTVSSINGNSMLGMPFGMGMYTLLVGETNGQYTNTATVYMNANDTVNIVVLDTMDMAPVPAVITLSFAPGEPVVEKTPENCFDRDPDNGYYIIESLRSPVDIFVGNDDICYTYTAESAGTVAVTPTVGGYEATNCWIKINDGSFSDYKNPVAVATGDIVVINIWSGYEGTVSMTSSAGEPDGDEPVIDQPVAIPSGSALTLGDNNVALNYATMPAMAPYWTYTAAEGGYLTVTVSSINGNNMLGMPFGMGMYTLLVGETDGQWTNTATVYMNANDMMNIAVLDTMDTESVPAVITLSFVPGEPVVEKNPADYFDRDPDSGYYIIGSLESSVDIFVGDDDICYTYTAESAGAVVITPTVDGYEATNCWIQVNDGGVAAYVTPVTVATGDIVIINIWSGYEGTVSMTAGGNEPGGESGESIPVQSGTESIAETGAVEFYFTPDADGVLTVTLSGDPGYKIWVYQVADDGSVGLAEYGTDEATYEYALVGGVDYRVYIIGYYNWSETAATITYEAFFEAKEVELPPVDIDKSDVSLELGANSVDLMENTIISLYEFIPVEPGVYTITVDGGVTMATYGFSTWNLVAEADNGVIVHTATAAEQTILIGLTADAASVTVTIEKTGDYTPAAQTEYVSYESGCPVVSEFNEPSDLVGIDVNKEQNVVLGDDGYYHLGTANGPIVYVKLNNEQFNLAVLYDAGAPITMRGIYIDENGDSHYYDFINMITDNYYDYSQVNDYHPLNKDLMIFLKAYGQSQGWYNANTSRFASVQSGEFVEESAWLASCYSTVSSYEPDKTGDHGFMGAVITMAISAFCFAAVLVVTKKKEF